MPWHSPWSDHIAKSVCKYLLQRYLGQFLEEKLTLDQLTVDLYKGIGTLTNVALDVQALNEVTEQQNIPFEFTDGFIEKISLSIPWSSILTDATNIEVEGLFLTLKKTEREETRVSMIESMWSSMTSSMQLAEDCLKKERDISKEDEGLKFEGIERFAQTIDSILSRIKVKFVNTKIRFEEVSENLNLGIAFQINITLMEYFDEGAVEEAEDKNNQSSYIPAFSTKKIFLDGVKLYSDEFTISGLTDSKLSSNSEDNIEAEDCELSMNIPIGCFSGGQEITIKYKKEEVEGPKVDLQICLGALIIFLSPHQAHNLLELLKGMSPSQNSRSKTHCIQKPMEESDFRKIEEELQMKLSEATTFPTKGLSNLGWANTCIDESENEFVSMYDSCKLNDSIISSVSSLNNSFTSDSSKSSQPYSHVPFQPKRKFYSGVTDGNTSPIIIHFHISLTNLSVLLLHEDIITCINDCSDNNVLKSSIEDMKNVANEFFLTFWPLFSANVGIRDLNKAREIFQNCCNRSHIRLTATPVIIEGSEISTTRRSVIKGKCVCAKAEILECLFEKDLNLKKKTVEIVELIKFYNSNEKQSYKTSLDEPNVIINFSLMQTNLLYEKNRKIIQPKSDLLIELQPFETEVDITIIDRLSALLNPNFFNTIKSKIRPFSLNTNPFSKEHVQQVVDDFPVPKTLQAIKVVVSKVTLKLRFPIPDLRPMHDLNKRPWWKRCVRKEVMYFNVSDVTLQTVLNSFQNNNFQDVSKYDVQFREVNVKFKEADSDSLIELANASAASNHDSLGDGGFGWARLVVSVYPKRTSSILEGSDVSTHNSKPCNHSLDYQALGSILDDSVKKEHSPFSCKKVIHESDTPHDKAAEQEGDELIIPGDNAEIADFIEYASINTRIKLDLTLPTVSILLPSKHLYEVIYNRISSDLLLWEPSAPVRDTFFLNSNFNCELSEDDIGPRFSLCKSAVQFDSDSDNESQDGIFYSVHEHKQRIRKKKVLENNNLAGQSKIVFHATVVEGFCNLYALVRDSQGNVIPRQHGHLSVSVKDGNFFLVTDYKGKTDLDYFCVQVNNFSFYHNGLVSDSMDLPTFLPAKSKLPDHLEPTLLKTEKCALIDQTTSVGLGTSDSLDMVTVSVRLQKNHPSEGLKMFRVAIGIREATLFHRVCRAQSSWLTQLIDFFDVIDYPISGYEPSTVLCEMHVHLWDCSVDYRPLYLPLRSVLTVSNFNVSSNIAAKTNSSTLRFLAEDAAFFISDKVDTIESANLRKDYVCVLELGLFELSLRLSENNHTNPKIDLRASSSIAHFRTCSDSAKALADLLMYFASDGDLTSCESSKDESEISSLILKEENNEQLLVETEDNEKLHSLSKSQVALVNDLMEEAMKESKMVNSKTRKSKEKREFSKTVYYEVNEEKILENDMKHISLGSELTDTISGFESDDAVSENWEEEFCIVQNEAGMGIMPKKGLPEVRNLTSIPVRLVDNHFSIPLRKADLLRSPKHYPQPVLRYMLREMSLVWHMYGGSDFETNASPTKNLGNNSFTDIVPAPDTIITFNKSSPSGISFKVKENNKSPNWKQRGGLGRRHDILMELQLNKVRFQNEVYPENTTEASRQVLLIQDVELRDRLASSSINKFLYLYSSETKPKQSQAPMVVIKSVLTRSDLKINAQECCLKVSLLPLRLNIDQDSILFLYRFFTDLSTDNKEEDEDCNSRAQTPKHQIPVMTVNVKGISKTSQIEAQPLLIDLEEGNQKKTTNFKSRRKGFTPKNKSSSQPIFIRCFIFSPDVLVRLDYQGKRLDMSHGSLAGILMGLGQLNNSELKLRKISHRHGLLGFDKLVNFVLSEWANDIKKNQLPSLLGGVGPMHSLVQLIQGIKDLFWLPIEQYQKDGRLVRGFQRGANSFTTSTAMASLELISRLIQIIQTTAETAYDMVSPGPSVRARRRNVKGKCKRYSQPADIREGMAIAYLIVKEGLGETADTILRVATEEHEQKGVTGAVGGVLRQIPPSVVKPIILATEASNNVIGGLKSQLVPDARKEAVEKWRGQDI